MPRPLPRLAALALAATVAGLGLTATPRIASAETYEELQQRVEETTAAYDQALDHVEKIKGQIAENEKKITQIEAKIPEQRERAADSLRTLYKISQSSGGLVELLLSSDDFNGFIATLTYLDRIQSRNVNELERLAALEAELQEAKDTLSARKAAADHEADAALQARDEALEAREEVRQQAIAQALAEQEAARKAIEQAAREAEEGKTFTTTSGNETEVTAPEDTTPPAETVAEDKEETEKEPEKEPERESEKESEKEEKEEPAQEEPAETQTEPEEEEPQEQVVSERDAFVAQWGPRIDSYLSGSPLYGHGNTFAQAAWDCNVDPRYSPAIAAVESSKGAICFLPHNAWGWGSASWGDWDSAIWGHVSGLAGSYGYTVSVDAAQRYCPPSWQEWYAAVLSEMSCI